MLTKFAAQPNQNIAFSTTVIDDNYDEQRYSFNTKNTLLGRRGKAASLATYGGRQAENKHCLPGRLCLDLAYADILPLPQSLHYVLLAYRAIHWQERKD